VVHGIPWSFTWKDLADFVRTAGQVIHTDIVYDPAGRSKGYGTVIFASQNDAKNAIQVSRISLHSLKSP
jgi:RNA recognition motif-containing protein